MGAGVFLKGTAGRARKRNSLTAVSKSIAHAVNMAPSPNVQCLRTVMTTVPFILAIYDSPLH